MSRPSTIFCFVLLVVSAAVIGLGLYWRSQFRAVEQAEPLRVPVDFSRIGQYGGPFDQKYEFGHDEGLELLVSPGFTSPDTAYEDASAVMQGLRGQVLIKDAAGSAVYEGLRSPWPATAALSPFDTRVAQSR